MEEHVHLLKAYLKIKTYLVLRREMIKFSAIKIKKLTAKIEQQIDNVATSAQRLGREEIRILSFNQ